MSPVDYLIKPIWNKQNKKSHQSRGGVVHKSNTIQGKTISILSKTET